MRMADSDFEEQDGIEDGDKDSASLVRRDYLGR